MSIINLGNDLPGISGPLYAYPRTGKALAALADALLINVGGTLSDFERELVATFVSKENECEFCYESHAHIAAEIGHIEPWRVKRIIRNPNSDRHLAMFTIARAVAENRPVQSDTLAFARFWLTEAEIHDVVLIAAAFSMFNRYVEAVGNPPPEDPADYVEAAQTIARQGYGVPA